MINLVRIGPTDFSSNHLEWLLATQFRLSMFDPTVPYDKDTLFVISRPNNYAEGFIDKILEQGHKLVIANPWEARPYLLSKDYTDYQDQILVILGCKNPYDYGWKKVIGAVNWFWYNESLWYTCDTDIRESIQNYTPNRINNKLFLMPIQRRKQFRDRIVERLHPFLDRAIWSYVEAWGYSQNLPRWSWSPFEKIRPDRIFEANWYDQTYFSLAVETAVDRLFDITREVTGLRSEEYPCDLFITEKTFKPIAYQHPFMVCGMQGVLDHLHSIGFETYDNIFDESYDDLKFFEQRLDIIYSNLENFSVSKYSDPVTEQKIQHNHNRFYDRHAVIDGFTQDIIEPMLEFANETRP
jgi:hypothetical protein